MKMKCYMFFMRASDYVKLKSYNINCMYIDSLDENILYAYTMDKNIAKAFKEMRNMDYFHIEKRKCTQEDVAMIRNKYITSELMNIRNREPEVDVDLIVTKEEYVLMQTDMQKQIIKLNFDFDSIPDIFSSKFKEALNRLKYYDITSHNVSELIHNNLIKVDYLNIFVKYFKEIIR